MVQDDATSATTKYMQEMKKELMLEMGKLYSQMAQNTEDMKSYFDLALENAVYDIKGANKDKIENHEDRIIRLEKHAGLVKM